MKKIILILSLFISGCVSSQTYHLDFFYASTCPRCFLFKNDVIPKLEKEYQDLMISLHDIDNKESLDLYAKTIDLLKDYHVESHSGSVPFIVLDGYFVKVGYSSQEKELLLKNIKKAMNNEQISLSTDYYLFQEGKTLY